MLQQAAHGELGSPDDGAWRDMFNRAWDTAIEAELNEARRLALTSWPPSSRWPRLNLKKARSRQLAGRIVKELDGADAVSEVTLTSRTGTLKGRPDLIVRSPVHEVWDFKTGSIQDSEGNLRTDYVIQLELYAKLEWDATGTLPSTAVIVPLDGQSRRWQLDAETVNLRARATDAALAAYNRQLSDGLVNALGSPSPSACRWCRFAPRCPAFWKTYRQDWWEDAIALRGVAVKRRTAARGAVALSLDVSGSVPDGSRVDVSGIDTTDHPSLAGAEIGMQVFIVGLRSVGRDRFAMRRSSSTWCLRPSGRAST